VIKEGADAKSLRAGRAGNDVCLRIEKIFVDIIV
jgi:hypothetical protein